VTAATNILAGGRILAAGIQGVAPNAVIKGATQAVPSSTTLVDDDALYVAVTANSTWMFAAMLAYTGAATGDGDLKFTFTSPSGSTLTWIAFGYTTAGIGSSDMSLSAVGASGTTRTFGSDGSTELAGLAWGTLINGATPGNLQLEWAQNTSSATATNMLAGSYLTAWQVS
jgi:hypothetical protein